MQNIQIDDQTYAYVVSKAIPYVEKGPGDTIKRLLGLTGDEIKTPAPDISPLKQNSQVTNKRPKGRKTNLLELVNLGYLKDGQTLTFRDYRGNLFPSYKVQISQGDLLWNNKRFSMSDLARQILQKQGHSTDSVRGPIFWVTDGGKTIADLWQACMEAPVKLTT